LIDHIAKFVARPSRYKTFGTKEACAKPIFPSAISCNAVKPRHVVEFAVGEQPGIGRDRGTTKLQRQTAVKIEPDGL
jgi:hypothetical protein